MEIKTSRVVKVQHANVRQIARAVSFAVFDQVIRLEHARQLNSVLDRIESRQRKYLIMVQTQMH